MIENNRQPPIWKNISELYIQTFEKDLTGFVYGFNINVKD